MTRLQAYSAVNELSAIEQINPEIVRGPKRDRSITEVRRRIAKQLRDKGMSYPEIGQALGGRHHTTVMYLLGAIPSKSNGYAKKVPA